MASYPATTAHYYDIRVPVAAQYGLSEPLMLVFTSDFLRRYRYIAVAQIWTCGEKKLGKAWHFGWSLQMAICDGWLRAMDALIGRICR